jgi:hypothetical protein
MTLTVPRQKLNLLYRLWKDAHECLVFAFVQCVTCWILIFCLCSV